MLYAPFKTFNAPGAVRFSGTSSVSVSGTLNDWNPTGLGTFFSLRVTPTAATTLTGIVAQLDGTMILIEHVGSSDYPFTVSDLNGGSSVPNQIVGGAYGSPVLRYRDKALIRYDETLTSWVLVTVFNDDFDQRERPSFRGRTEASWWKLPGAAGRGRFGMVEPETLDADSMLSIDNADGPWLRLSTGTSPYPGAGSGACGIRTGPYLFQPRWGVSAWWERVSIPTSLSDTRAWWGCFSIAETYGLSSLTGIQAAAFRFDASVHGTLLYSVTSDGSSVTEKQLTDSTPQTEHNYDIKLTSTGVKFYEDDRLVSEHSVVENLPNSSTFLGHNVNTELVSPGSTIRSLTWARSGYSHG